MADADDMIRVTLPDGSEKELPAGSTLYDLAASIGPGLAKAAMAGLRTDVDDTVLEEGASGAEGEEKFLDLREPLPDGATIRIVTDRDPEALDVLRHSAAHIMATAIQNLWPEVSFAFGPWIEDGFYYDIDLDRPLTEDDLEAIEKEMARIVKADEPFERRMMDKQEAIEFFEERDEPYKVEKIRELEDGTISFFQNGDFTDLCAGPHVRSTGDLKAFKLMKVAGAYWRGDESRPMLQRVYGTAWLKQKDLDDHLHRMEEARRRDHRRLGVDLDLFSFREEGPGFAFFHPNGMVLWNELIGLLHERLEAAGYGEVRTPVMLRRELWERSGHWEHYRDNMYLSQVGDEEEDEGLFAVKPMNCPGAILIYKSRPHSYRELPLRMAEQGLCHRHEKKGVLHGLARVRQFTQDDAHVFLTPDQIEDEIVALCEFTDDLYGTFGLEYSVELSTRPAKYMGDEALWDKAEASLQHALERMGWDFRINPGDGAFYGPKIDFHVRDSLKRSWQCGTVQVDFAQPENFDLSYVGADNTEHRPVIIHRAIMGSIERFFAILVEHFGGAFPTWLAPEQVRILPVTDDHLEYARKVASDLRAHRIRASADDRSEKTGWKIREAETSKVPYICVVGDREVDAQTVSVRRHGGLDLGAHPVESFRDALLREVGSRAMEADPELAGSA